MSLPNIIYILADDMGYGDFGRFNGGLSSTPHLERLIDAGCTATQHYSASPVCNPSRAAIMTGRYPHRTGSVDTLEWRGLERLRLDEITVADCLRARGYATGLVGKWHLGAFDPRFHPQRRGFDEAVCFRGGMHDYYDWRLEWGDSIRRGDGRYLTDVFSQEAASFIRRHQKEPFFLHLTYNAPHTPLQLPESYLRKYLDRGNVNRAVASLYGMIERMDEGIGQVLDTLAECGLEENTLVVFSSDNGPQFGGEGENCQDRFNCNFRASKGKVYEGGIRVPAVCRWPERIAPGTTVESMIHMCDWLPTFAEISGASVPEDRTIDGSSQLSALAGEAGRVPEKRFWQWNRYSPVYTSNAAMREGPWKLVRPVLPEVMTVPDIQWLEVSMYNPEHFLRHGIITDPDPPRTVPPAAPVELYNLETDPGESRNLAAEESARTARMLGELEAWAEAVEQDRLRPVTTISE